MGPDVVGFTTMQESILAQYNGPGQLQIAISWKQKELPEIRWWQNDRIFGAGLNYKILGKCKINAKNEKSYILGTTKKIFILLAVVAIFLFFW